MLNMSANIPTDDINAQINLLQEVKAMLQQLKVTIPAYSGDSINKIKFFFFFFKFGVFIGFFFQIKNP